MLCCQREVTSKVNIRCTWVSMSMNVFLRPLDYASVRQGIQQVVDKGARGSWWGLQSVRRMQGRKALRPGLHV